MILSIVMPIYNSETHMEGALRSAAPLLGVAAELIVVDDGSTDKSVLKFRQLQREVPLPNSRILCREHSGVSVARNHGLEAATGEYVLFLDSDDWISPELLEAVGVQSESPDIVCWGWDTESPTGEILRRYFDVHPVLPDRMTGIDALGRRTVDRTLRLWTSSAAYRRCFLEEAELRFTPGCAVGEDLEFSYRALLNASEVAFVPHVLAVYRKRYRSTTSISSVERFASVLALRRVLRLLESDGRREVEEVAVYFRKTKEIVNYLHTLEGCLRLAGLGNPRGLLREIEKQFPGLNMEIRTAIRSNSGSLPIEWLVFANSPVCWWAWVRARRYVDRFLSPRFKSTGPLAEKRRALRLGR